MPIIRSSRLYVCYYRLWCAVFGCWLSGVRFRAAGYASRKRDVARLSSRVTDIGVDWSSNRNEYQEYFLLGKSGRWIRLKIFVLNSGKLKILVTSWPVQAYTGIADRRSRDYWSTTQWRCMGVWRYSSTYCQPRRQIEIRGQFHVSPHVLEQF